MEPGTLHICAFDAARGPVSAWAIGIGHEPGPVPFMSLLPLVAHPEPARQPMEAKVIRRSCRMARKPSKPHALCKLRRPGYRRVKNGLDRGLPSQLAPRGRTGKPGEPSSPPARAQLPYTERLG